MLPKWDLDLTTHLTAVFSDLFIIYTGHSGNTTEIFCGMMQRELLWLINFLN